MARYPSKKSKSAAPKESKADKESISIENDIIEFWFAIGNSDLQDWKKPWVYKIIEAENAGKFMANDQRYVYKGGFNQFLIASYTRNYNSDLANLVLNRTDLSKFFGVESFADTPIVKNGVKSIGSIYSPPVDKVVGKYWERPDKSRWSDGDRKEPTPEQIAQQRLTEKTIKRPVFSTFPVWSAHDVYKFLPEEHQKKIDELVELRNRKGYDFNPEDPVEELIDRIIDDVIDRQGIEVTEHGNSAYYVPSLDIISKPKKEQFINPVARYAVTMHELAHSTKHIASRLAQSKGKHDTDYAIEEVVAETTAVMMVKQLEKQLADVLPSRPDIQIMFQEYYSNAMSYNHGWGEKFDFNEKVAQLAAERENQKGLIKTIIVNIAKAVDILNNGEYSRDMRLEFKQKNYDKMLKKSNSPELTM